MASSEGPAGIAEAIQAATAAYVEALSAVGKTLQKLAGQSGFPDRDRVVENWLRVARMSKDGVVNALEHGFELWEREVRRVVSEASGTAQKAAGNPTEAWAENLRKATEAFTSGSAGWGEEARKQAETVQKTLADGMRAWQRLWEQK
jgi:hypothetical protein